MEKHQFSVIHQRAGEFLYLPAGWGHAVYHATPTVMVGFSLLHPWNMHLFNGHTEANGKHDWLDTDAVIAAYEKHATKLDVTKGEAKTVGVAYRRACAAYKSAKEE